VSELEKFHVQNLRVSADEAELRLDRWFRRRFPELGHGRLEKLLRTGQVRVDGRRAKAGLRLAAGQTVRVPPLGASEGRRAQPKPPPRIDSQEAEALQARVLHIDDWLIALDKPAGLAVQGGSGLGRHLDALSEALRFGAAEKPRLVHRLDKDTSGVLVLARTAASARHLTAAFRGQEARKTYWAAVVGVPERRQGRIDLALLKGRTGAIEKVTAGEAGQDAVTLYRLVQAAGKRAAWLALRPLTGRTHRPMRDSPGGSICTPGSSPSPIPTTARPSGLARPCRPICRRLGHGSASTRPAARPCLSSKVEEWPVVIKSRQSKLIVNIAY
jgi:23S rRNA pseudouridine955/2504/2580 synthase